MATKVDEVRRAAIELLKTSNDQDEFGLVVFGGKPRIAVNLPGSPDAVATVVASLQPDGFTSLWDGIYLGLLEQKEATHPRRAIVVISTAVTTIAGTAKMRSSPCSRRPMFRFMRSESLTSS